MEDSGNPFQGMLERREMEDSSRQKVLKWLSNLSIGSVGHEVETLTTKGTRLVKDESGNWHVGAIATLIDIIGSTATYSFTASDNVTLDFTISYYSTAKVQEEVEVEAKVVGKKGRLISVIVEVRKKENGELIALGKQWMAPAYGNARHQASKL